MPIADGVCESSPNCRACASPIHGDRQRIGENAAAFQDLVRRAMGSGGERGAARLSRLHTAR
jgi:hypothetical protein